MLTPIKEDFLHYLWRTKKVPLHHFETTDGRSVEVIDYGMYNVDSGPDFFNDTATTEIYTRSLVGSVRCV